MIRSVLIPNRGEIAVRVARACRDEGLRSVAGVSRVDVQSMAAQAADDVVSIGPNAATDSYLSVGAVTAAALLTGCDALHPGYGFLSERPELAEACVTHGITFVGPSAETIRRGGDKIAARKLARSLGIPVGAGSDAVEHRDEAAAIATQVGFPVLLKAAAGGGGRGMVLVSDPETIGDQFDRASNEARSAFGDGRLYVEHYVEDARHVEVQILADTHGGVIHLGDRDCSLQRRYQKIVEEAPAVSVGAGLRAELADAAITLARALDYVGAGTVEFIVDRARDTFAFLEVNTRVQVEHPATEMVTGIDIVREQLRIAGGARLSHAQDDVRLRGHAIECRVNAESVSRGFLPSPGEITTWVMPQGNDVRVDTHGYPGYVVPPDYDSLIAKLIVCGSDRAAAIERMEAALRGTRIGGIDTTLPFLGDLVGHPDFRTNAINTRWVEETLL